MKTCALLLVLALVCFEPDAHARQSQTVLAPTHANIAYGEYPNQVLDFWRADVDGPAPLVIYIHGGGFRGGSKDRVNSTQLQAYLDSGIHFASIEYRLLGQAKLPAAHRDVQRALQFIRSRAGEWGIDKDRIGASGGSAGAQLAAYLAWKDDAADPDGDDPVAAESTRVAAVAGRGCQATMDMSWWVENIPGYDKPHRPVSDYADVTGEDLDALIRDLSVINHISPDDPPVFLSYGMNPSDPVPENNANGWKVHHVNFGLALQDELRKAGVEVTLKYPGANPRFRDEVQFFQYHLLGSTAADTAPAQP